MNSKVLWSNSDEYTDKDLKNYFTLIDPTEYYLYDCGHPACGCSEGDSYTMEGRFAVNELEKSGAYRLIEYAVYGSNPAGRIYAFEKLEKLEQKELYSIPDITKERIRYVKNLELGIDICGNYLIMYDVQKPPSYNTIKRHHRIYEDSLYKYRYIPDTTHHQ